MTEEESPEPSLSERVEHDLANTPGMEPGAAAYLIWSQVWKAKAPEGIAFIKSHDNVIEAVRCLARLAHSAANPREQAHLDQMHASMRTYLSPVKMLPFLTPEDLAKMNKYL